MIVECRTDKPAFSNAAIEAARAAKPEEALLLLPKRLELCRSV